MGVLEIYRDLGLELRMAFAESFLRMAYSMAPTEHKHTKLLAEAIENYCRATLLDAEKVSDGK